MNDRTANPEAHELYLRGLTLLAARGPGMREAADAFQEAVKLDPEYALALLEGGSAGRAYLLKERVSNPDQLLGAVREVAQGGSVIDPKVVEALIAQRARAAHSPLADLTPREREVLAGMAEGKTNAAIAEALALTPRAVEKHINVIFSKLPLDQQPAVDRRVTAVLLFLAETA